MSKGVAHTHTPMHFTWMTCQQHTEIWCVGSCWPKQRSTHQCSKVMSYNQAPSWAVNHCFRWFRCTCICTLTHMYSHGRDFSWQEWNCRPHERCQLWICGMIWYSTSKAAMWDAMLSPESNSLVSVCGELFCHLKDFTTCHRSWMEHVCLCSIFRSNKLAVCNPTHMCAERTFGLFW